MPYLVVRARILPSSVEVDLEELALRIERGISNVGGLLRYSLEPIAFGLSAIIADFKIEEKEGGTYPLEEAIKAIDGVDEVDIIAVSRAYTKI